jgi:hypothetical protein
MNLAVSYPQLARAEMVRTFEEQQRQLLAFNGKRLSPGCITDDWRQKLERDHQMLVTEGAFIETERGAVQSFVEHVPDSADAFIDWFEDLREAGPGQGDLLFPWLADTASLPDMRWFLSQEVAGEAGFDDLVALSQIKLPSRPKLEMARNYWDEMGRGNEKGMHGPMLGRLAQYLDIAAPAEEIVAESIALGNLMIGLASNRRYAFQAIGALGAIELTAPTRAVFVDRGLRRLGIPTSTRQYFAVHALLDVEHSRAWNVEVLAPLVEEDGRRARWLAEGALMRLVAGQRCFRRYRAQLWTLSL